MQMTSEQKIEKSLSFEQPRSYKKLTEDELENVERKGGGEYYPIEKIFKRTEIPPWSSQLTLRAIVVSLMIGSLCSALVTKLNLSTGMVPPVGMYAGMLGFSLIKTFTIFLHRCGMFKQPFTRQENCIIQTCVIAISSISLTGGLASYIFGMSEITAKQIPIGNDPQNIKNPGLGWMIGLLLLTSFLSLFSMLPLRKALLADHKMVYPSGTASGHLLNSIHVPLKSKFTKKQVKTLGKFMAFSFSWSTFMWFFAAGPDCGFRAFPTFGLKAYDMRFNFDFSSSYVGVGMISPHITPVSLLMGAILSWGIMWPYIATKKGDWYPASLSSSSAHGLGAYRVFIGISLLLGDGLYNYFKILVSNLSHHVRNNVVDALPVDDHPSLEKLNLSYNEKARNEIMLNDHIPAKVAIGGYVALVAISIAVLPHIFPQIKWYYVLAIYIMAPALGFSRAYGGGLCDLALSSPYGKVVMFLIGPWAGAAHSGVFVGLTAYGMVTNFAATASDLMLNFRTGYLTLTSPKSLFLSHVIGTAIGCVISPCMFWYFYKTYPDIGTSSSKFPVDSAYTFRNLATLAIDGLSALPKNCLLLCYVFFTAAIIMNILRDTLPKKWARFIPLPTAIALPFNVNGTTAIDMCVGSLILFVWKLKNKAEANAFAPIVAAGLLGGDGIFILPNSILHLIGWEAPICMNFMSREMYRDFSSSVQS